MNKIEFSDHTMIKKTFKDGFKDITKMPKEIKENKRNYLFLTIFFLFCFTFLDQTKSFTQDKIIVLLSVLLQTLFLPAIVTLTVFKYSEKFRDSIIPALKNAFTITNLSFFLTFLFLIILGTIPVLSVIPMEIFSLSVESISSISSNPEYIDPALANTLSNIDYNNFIIAFAISSLILIFVLVIGFFTIILNLSFDTLGFFSALKISLAFNLRNAGYFTSYTLIILPLLLIKYLMSMIAIPLIPIISSGLFTLSVFIIFAHMIKNTIEDK